MDVRCFTVGLALLAASWLWVPAAFAGACSLGKLAEFPITMVGLRPLMTAKINDQDVRLTVDSGAFYSMLSAASAAQLKLATYPAPFGLSVIGVGGGSASASIAKVKVFTLAGVPLHNVEFLVGGSEVGAGSIGLLGQNVLHIADVEYDLGQGVVRLMRPHDCDKAMLAYWVNDTTTPYSVIEIGSTSPQMPFTGASALINGTPVRVRFDSGASVSVLSLRAAARVGIKPDSPGVTYAGEFYGIGRNTMPTYIAPFASFKMGEEEIRNTRLRIADIDLSNADMLIGADFFLSHHIYVATRQHKLYFTYNGGAVFNLSSAKHASGAPADAAGEPAPASSAEPAQIRAAAGEPATGNAVAGDAADYGRRGAAFASRRDFAQALTNLTRACELAPDDADYVYQRGVVRRELQQGALAMADFDRALTLKPDHVAALVARAELALQGGDRSRADADLGAADAAAPRQADVRLMMAGLYQRADLSGPAITQYDWWIAAHTQDARLPEALNSRCWVRALAGIDLAMALSDCNAALRRTDRSSPLYARALDSRGLVRLRMGDYDRSLSDYDASLKIRPDNAWGLYGRGVDEHRKHSTAEGDADMARAKAIWPQVADEFTRRGITP